MIPAEREWRVRFYERVRGSIGEFTPGPTRIVRARTASGALTKAHELIPAGVESGGVAIVNPKDPNK